MTDLPITFAAGQTTATVTVLIHNDTVAADGAGAVESDERFALILQSASSDPGTTYLARATFTIYDDDGTQADVPFTDWQADGGDWADADNWKEGLPDANTDADTGPGLGTVITYSLVDGAARALRMQDAINSLGDARTFEMTGGSLTLSTSSRIGELIQTGGTLTFRNGVVRPDNSIDFEHPDIDGASSDIGLTMTQGASGTIVIESGSLTLEGVGNSIGGTISGAGELIIGSTIPSGGSTTWESTGNILTDKLSIDGTGAIFTVDFDANYSGDFSQSPQTHLYIGAGKTFSLTGDAFLSGEVHTGTLAVNGGGNANALTIDDGATVLVNSTVRAVDGWGNSLDIGNSNASTAGTLSIGSEGVWNMLGVYGATLGTLGVITNAGILEKTNAGDVGVNGGTVNSTGTINAGRSDTTITFASGAGSFAGHLTGDGTLDFSGDYTLASGVEVDVANLGIIGTGTTLTLGGDLDYDGSFLLGGTGAHLGGHILTLGGQVTLDTGGVGSGFYGSGTARITGSASGQISHGETWISGDTNGDHKADFLIHLDGKIHLEAGDFIL